MARSRARRVTQADIARHAGVSTAAVSLVLNDIADGRVRISAATQQRVRDAMQELGYVPNTAARQLARGRTNVIGVFTYEPIFPLDASNFYQPFLVGIEEAASHLDFNLLLLTGGVRNGKRTIYEHGTNRLLAAEGAVLLGTNEDRAELKRLHDSDYPFVFVGRREIDGQNIPASAANYAEASEHLLLQILEAGHRNIVVTRAGNESESEADRFRGVHAAVSQHADVTYTECLIGSEPITGAWVDEQLANGATAIVCSTTPAAVRVLDIAVAKGISVPDNLSVASLGNADNPVEYPERLTSYVIPHREMGAAALELLAKMLANEDLPQFPITVPCTFVPGSTIAPPRKVSAISGKGGT